MSSCMIKGCTEEAHEEGLCALHFKNVVKNIMPKMSKEIPSARKEPEEVADREEISVKTQFFLLSILTHVDKFANSLIDSFGNVFSLNKNEVAGIYRQISSKLMSKEKNQKAIPILNKLVDLDPNDVNSRFKLGLAYFSNGLFEDAITHIVEAIALDPENDSYHFQLGRIYEENKAWKKALESYNNALKINPDDAEIHYRMGVVYDNLEDFKKAIITFSKAIDLNPKEANYYQSLGFAHEGIDQHKDAVKCFKNAISIQQS